ncbi:MULTISPECIES: type VI secretion system baseplate subunit TssE [unclassified Agarivorans]|uniref:type VI secretion system baseplate subunit TssE n=1 Tax=unclassified Agarivorans TaxID=2636026 RepID=UPI0010DEF11C|nr:MULTISPECIES: type VI secretion system baseplate subunit TssE [unclassified Agarivorans]MDO6685497.1 type VI secretion system baseplate subunit TssE [Agarivorans sp. 3_MG-2023]MDO6715883.1 type VI secretion system baseplate subunit TssE [Agarivorans sp. 2_MG-2023]MDO6764926.1 type VI secretion system baseplate subunit TssE [Agarivorans sp. 1_MG-2023]GDY25306.1 lysozyme [Agarivorans sp. Toyoura001]
MSAVQPALQLSLLDRLSNTLDEDINSTNVYSNYGRQAYRRSIRRDLEALLNAKLHWHTWPEWYGELDLSLFSYGLPDFSSMPLSSQDGRDKLCQIVEQTIRKFEPRFIDLSVTTVSEEQPLDRVMRLRIHALCHADPEPEEMTFDSEVEPLSLGIKIVE